MKRVHYIILVSFIVALLVPIDNVEANTARDRVCENSSFGADCSYPDTTRTGTQRTINGKCNQGFWGGLYCDRRLVDQEDQVTPPPGGGGGGGDPVSPPGGGGDGGTPVSPPGDASSPQQVSFQNPSRFTSIPELLAGIVNAALGLLGGLAVILIVFSGIKYMMSSNPGDVAKATEGIRNAIVGLMVVMGAYLIVQFVISALV